MEGYQTFKEKAEYHEEQAKYFRDLMEKCTDKPVTPAPAPKATP